MSPHFFRYCPIKSTYNCDGNDISNVNSIIESFALALGTIMLVKIKIPIKIKIDPKLVSLNNNYFML